MTTSTEAYSVLQPFFVNGNDDHVSYVLGGTHLEFWAPNQVGLSHRHGDFFCAVPVFRKNFRQFWTFSMPTDPFVAELAGWITEHAPLAIGFSGGVDSATLARAAVLFSPKNSPPIAFMATNAASTTEEIFAARGLADQIGIRLVECATPELQSAELKKNGPDRCYHCKKIRFTTLKEKSRSEGGENSTWVDGSNADDQSDYRPGTLAAQELGIRSPLAELGMTKSAIRQLAAAWSLSVAELPSNPCLLTRLAYGMEPTEPLLRAVEAAEVRLREAGFWPARARIDAVGSLRIEVLEADIPRILEPHLKKRLLEAFTTLGFQQISVDLEGFATGKMNRIFFYSPQPPTEVLQT